MKYINPEQIKNELENINRPIPYQSHGFPYNNLDNNQFEILLYYIFKEKINRGEFEKKFDDVHLMPGTKDRGRDCLLTWKGLNVGLIQCKKYEDKLSRNKVGEEIIKFVLYYLDDTSLISDPNNFTYYFAVSNDFKENAINLFNELNSNKFEEKEIKGWAEKIIRSYKTLQDFEIEKNLDKIFKVLGKIKILKITATDLDLALFKYSNIASKFFSVTNVVTVNDLKEELSSPFKITNTEMNNELSEKISIDNQILYTSPHPIFFIGRNSELKHLREALKLNNTIIINGIAGIGKTYLISQFLELFISDLHVIWLDLNNMSNLENILVNIAMNFNNNFNDSELINVLKSSSQIHRRIQIAANLIERFKSIVIVDNFNYKKNSRILPLLQKCNEIMNQGRLFIITREAIAEHNFLNPPYQYTLKGLKEDKSIILLKYYFSQFNLNEPIEEILIDIHQKLEGHPYFMRMVVFLSQWISLDEISSNIFEYGVDLGNYIHNEIWEILSES